MERHLVPDHAVVGYRRAVMAAAFCAGALAGLVAPQQAPAGQTSSAAHVRFATWHIDDLWHEAGRPLRSAGAGERSMVRSASDFRSLRAAASELDADVIALQSVGSPQAVRRVFPASDYHLVFSRQLLARVSEDPAALEDSRRRAGYTAVVVRRGRNLRVQRVEQIGELAYAGEQDESADGTAGLAVELGVDGERIWVLAVDLDERCEAAAEPANPVSAEPAAADAGPSLACPGLAHRTGVLDSWIATRQAEGADFIIAGSLNRALGRHRADGAADPLWASLDGGNGDGSETELASAFSPAPWKLIRRREKAKARVIQPIVRAEGTEDIGVGRLAERTRAASEEAESGEKAPETALEILSAAIRSFVHTERRKIAEARAARAAEEKRRAEEAARLAAAAEATRKLAAGSGGTLAATTAGSTPEEAASRGVVVGARIARFPDGRGSNPCAAEGRSDPPLDYILIGRRLATAESLVGFGAMPIEAPSARIGMAVDAAAVLAAPGATAAGTLPAVGSPAAERASSRCPLFVDLHL